MAKKNLKAAPTSSGEKYIYGLIVVVFFCIFGAIYKKKNVESRLRAQAYESAQKKLKENKELTPSERQSIGQDPNRSRGRTMENRPGRVQYRAYEKPATPLARELLAKQSKESIESFEAVSHIKLELPGSLNYIKLNSDEGFAGIYGVDPVNNTKLTGLAYGQTASPQQVAEFLKNDSANVPNIAQNPITQMSPPEQLPPPPQGSGLGTGTIMYGKLEKGEDVAAVYVERADKKGAYLFILSGPHSYFEKNEGAFDSVYENAKALPGNEK